jgi:hypothetical protein
MESRPVKPEYRDSFALTAVWDHVYEIEDRLKRLPVARCREDEDEDNIEVALSQSNSKYFLTNPSSSRGKAAIQYVRADGRDVKMYAGEKPQAVRGKLPIHTGQDGLFYYETRIRLTNRASTIAIGVIEGAGDPDGLPGEMSFSYGYVNDGSAHHGYIPAGHNPSYGPSFTEGDVVGALLDRKDGTIRYFKNGKDLGVAFKGVTRQDLYPVVGVFAPDDQDIVKFTLNFGQQPYFKEDVSGWIKMYGASQALLRAARQVRELELKQSSRERVRANERERVWRDLRQVEDAVDSLQPTK